MNRISVDFSEITGEVKPLNSVNCAPYSHGWVADPERQNEKLVKLFKEANIPYSRLHDCCGAWGGTHFVDVPNIFPNFEADENDPANYDFHYTDEYIYYIQKSGAESYYRLGITIEWGSKKYTAAAPPSDFEKWARICEHIIMHYNEGWADGFHYNLKYWEIWNEPEQPGDIYGNSMWGGTKEEFFELYKVSSKYLKSKFPELKIGGYGSCGFYAITREDASDVQKGFVTYFTDFLKMIKENDCPLDFFSWHIYSGDEKEIFTHAEFVRKTLDEYGFKNTETHLNEWNIGAEGKSFAQKHTMEGGSFLGAVMCHMQNTNFLDNAMYYCFSSGAAYNGFLDNNDFSVSPAWFPFVAFGHLYSLKNAVKTTYSGNVYAASAKSESEYAIMISNYNGEEENTKITINGIDGIKKASVLYCTNELHLEKEFSCSVYENSEIEIKIPEETVVLIKIC